MNNNNNNTENNNSNSIIKSEAIASGTVSEDEMEAVDDAGFLTHKARTRSQSHELVLLHSITTTTTTSTEENGGRQPHVHQEQEGGGGGEVETKTWQQMTPNHDLNHSTIRGSSDLKASIEPQPQNEDQLIVYDTRC